MKISDEKKQAIIKALKTLGKTCLVAIGTCLINIATIVLNPDVVSWITGLIK